MVSTGYPYKGICLMRRGLQIELCGTTAAVHNWRNEDLLPEVKVNTNAIARMSRLVQAGFAQITNGTDGHPSGKAAIG